MSTIWTFVHPHIVKIWGLSLVNASPPHSKALLCLSGFKSRISNREDYSPHPYVTYQPQCVVHFLLKPTHTFNSNPSHIHPLPHRATCMSCLYPNAISLHSLFSPQSTSNLPQPNNNKPFGNSQQKENLACVCSKGNASLLLSKSRTRRAK